MGVFLLLVMQILGGIQKIKMGNYVGRRQKLNIGGILLL